MNSLGCCIFLAWLLFATNLSTGQEVPPDRHWFLQLNREHFRHIDVKIGLPYDKVQLIGYSDKVTAEVCMSMETAIFAGWKYQLYGPGIQMRRSHYDNVKNFKQTMLANIINKLPNDTIVISADTFDVIYQGNQRTFAHMFDRVLQKDRKTFVLYNNEQNCWPFTYLTGRVRCDFMQGEEYVNLRIKRRDNWGVTKVRPQTDSNGKISSVDIPHACFLLAERFRNLTANTPWSTSKFRVLNGGVSIGTVAAQKSLLLAISNVMTHTPKTCHDDQGIINWLMVNNLAPVTIDYSISLATTAMWAKVVFDKKSGSFHIDPSASVIPPDSDMWAWTNYNLETGDFFIDPSAPATVNKDPPSVPPPPPTFDCVEDIGSDKNTSGTNWARPLIIHHTGDKSRYRLSREYLIKHRFNTDIKAYMAFLNESFVWLNGEQKGFLEVCGKDMHIIPSFME